MSTNNFLEICGTKKKDDLEELFFNVSIKSNENNIKYNFKSIFRQTNTDDSTIHCMLNFKWLYWKNTIYIK